MCNPIACFLIFLIHDVSWSKIFEDVISGLVLIGVGFWAFKRQESYKASAQEVREICKKAKEFLKVFEDLNLKFEQFEFSIRTGYQIRGLVAFPNKFVERRPVENLVSVQVLRSVAPGIFDVVVPDELNREILFQETLFMLRAHGMRATTAIRVLMENLDGFLNGEPNFDEVTIRNVWEEYIASKRNFSSRLKSFNLIIHNAIHGSYDWNKFSDEIETILKEGKDA
jgi:hypothetical protein